MVVGGEMSPDLDSTGGHPGPPRDEWALQADAAHIAGCSVSAIRKWRREGVVSDRRRTTAGGLDRVEVRLQDVLERCGREPQHTPAAAAGVEQDPNSGHGNVLIPLADLQALILRVGEAERLAHVATNGPSMPDAEAQRLTEALSRSEAGLAAARSELEKQKYRLRELETAGSRDPSPPSESRSVSERLREQLVRLEARMSEARSEIEGQRRRIRELESRPPAPSPKALATEEENTRLRVQLSRIEGRLSEARTELDAQRQRIRELETRQPASPTSTPAADAEYEHLRKQVATLEARMAESRSASDSQRRRIRELEALQPMSSESELTAEALREQVAALEAHLTRARDELDGQRRRTRELEAHIARSSQRVPTEPTGGPSRSRRRPVLPAPRAAAPYDDEQQPASPPAPARNARWDRPQVMTVDDATPQYPEAPASTLVDSPPPEAPAPDTHATRLRRLYRRLQTHPRTATVSAEERGRWVADLAAYDEALVLACIELGVPTSFSPGQRLHAEDRVALTRALGAAGLIIG